MHKSAESERGRERRREKGGREMEKNKAVVRWHILRCIV